WAFRRASLDLDLLFTVGVTVMFLSAIYIASGWEFGAKLVPLVVSWTAVILLAFQMISKMFYKGGTRQETTYDLHGNEVKQGIEETDVHFDIVVDFGDLSVKPIMERALVYFGWLFFFFGFGAIIGLLPCMFFFLVGYMRFVGREAWGKTLLIASVMWAFCYYLFHKILIIPWPQSVIGDLFPVLRTMNDINLF